MTELRMSLALRVRAVFPLPFFFSFLSLGLTMGLGAAVSPAQAGQAMGGHSPGARVMMVRRPPVLSAPVRPVARPVRPVAAPHVRFHRAPRHHGIPAGHWRKPTQIWLDPNVYQPRVDVVSSGYAPIVHERPVYDYGHPGYFRGARRQQRCTAPKIIQIGPIDRQAGAGPRLIYGTKNPCGSATFQNLYKPKMTKGKKAKRGLVLKY